MRISFVATVPGGTAHRRLRAFTLIELSVVIAIIMMLIGFLFLAVQKVRASAVRTQCADNLRKIGMATHQFENVHSFFPPGAVQTDCPQLGIPVGAYHNWPVFLLPYLEHQAVYDLYRFDKNWTSMENNAAATAVVSAFLCPSEPSGRRLTVRGGIDSSAGAIDYNGLFGINPVLSDLGFTDNLGPNTSQTYRGVMIIYGYAWPLGAPPERFLCRTADVQDGLSQTILVGEQAGWPRWYTRQGFASNGGGDWSGWAGRGPLWLYGFTYDATNYGSCAINCYSKDIYSFHPQGANVLFCDGTVSFLNQDIPVRLVARLITRAGEEVIDPRDY
jgi:prepilin-type processing-associated H-X9-DG protein